MGRKKMTTVETETDPITAATMTKTDAVKKSLADGITKPKEIVEHAKNKYGVELDANYASILKSKITKAGGAGGKKRGPKAGTTKTATNGKATAFPVLTVGATLKEYVRGLVILFGRDDAKTVLADMVDKA